MNGVCVYVCVTLIRVVSEYHAVTPAYIGSPTEIISGEEKLIHPMAMDDQEDPPQMVDDHPGATSQSDEEPDTSEEFNEDDTILLEGNVYPLNSKK